jgi:pyruvate formate lyase activating enzyme
MKEARYWTALDHERVHCSLCPQSCRIGDGKTGFCGVRKNEGGRLYSLVWGKAIAGNVDPIEKKPLFHFLPGSLSFSIATVGCNFRCAFCQNSDISQYPQETGRVTGEDLPPEAVVEAALARRCASVSYTYTEPTIYLEYAVDTARLARGKGLANVMVTNGYICPDIVKTDLKGLVDAANIDLKAFSDAFYKRLCSARLQPVLDAIRAYHDSGIWIEVTTLVIPGENDSPDELRAIARFIASVSPDIPWHLSRYYPRYRYEGAPPTPVAELEEARGIGLSEGLRYVYTGNVPGHEGESTFCPGCGRKIISRQGYVIAKQDLLGDTCKHCGTIIAGRFS